MLTHGHGLQRKHMQLRQHASKDWLANKAALVPHLALLAGFDDGVLDHRGEAVGQRGLLEPRLRHNHAVRRDDEPHVLHAEDDGVVPHQDLARLRGQQVGVQQPHVPDRHAQPELLRSAVHLCV